MGRYTVQARFLWPTHRRRRGEALSRSNMTKIGSSAGWAAGEDAVSRARGQWAEAGAPLGAWGALGGHRKRVTVASQGTEGRRKRNTEKASGQKSWPEVGFRGQRLEVISAGSGSGRGWWPRLDLEAQGKVPTGSHVTSSPKASPAWAASATAALGRPPRSTAIPQHQVGGI